MVSDFRPRSVPVGENAEKAAKSLGVVIRACGGVIAFSKKMDVSRQTVSLWIRRGYISANKANEASKLSLKVSKFDLRPDVKVWY